MPPRPVMPFLLKLAIFCLAMIAASSVMTMIDMRSELNELRRLHREAQVSASVDVNSKMSTGLQAKFTSTSTISVGPVNLTSTGESGHASQIVKYARDASIGNSMLTWDGTSLIFRFDGK